MMISIRYGSHLPVLAKLVEITNGPILELGIGLYSTPYLHYACLPTKRKLSSYENHPRWLRYFRDSRNDYHDLNLMEDWDKLEINQIWDIALIDNDPEPRRKEDAKRLAHNAKYIVLHDSEPERDDVLKYSEIYPLFKYRYDYTLVRPNTTVLSNYFDLENLW